MRISDWSSDVCSSDLITNIESVGSVRADLARGFYKLFGPLLGIIETKHPVVPRAFSGKRKSPGDRKPRRGASWSDAYRHQYIEGRAFILFTQQCRRGCIGQMQFNTLAIHLLTNDNQVAAV